MSRTRRSSRALGAAGLLTGTLGKLGKGYVLEVRLVDVEGSKILRNASVNLASRDADDLVAAAQKVLAELF